MKEVYFKSLMIADLQNRTARVQLFEKGLNVVTSADNHVGKSSLLKSLYYTLGAEVDYDSVWDKQSKLYIATLAVGEKEYRVARFLKRFAVFEGEKLLKITDSVTKELAPLLGEIFDFSVYLPRKDTGKVEMAPPVFTFMPYYIDQDKGWSGYTIALQQLNSIKVQIGLNHSITISIFIPKEQLNLWRREIVLRNIWKPWRLRVIV